MNKTSLIVFATLITMFVQYTPARADKISAKAAFERAQSGEMLIVDIRRPSEWKQTGIAKGAHTISLERSGIALFKKLETATQNDKTKPIGIICATGGRTSFLMPYLKQAGFTNVYDIAEGMLGNNKGIGWIKEKLPMEKWTNPKTKTN